MFEVYNYQPWQSDPKPPIPTYPSSVFAQLEQELKTLREHNAILQQTISSLERDIHHYKQRIEQLEKIGV